MQGVQHPAMYNLTQNKTFSPNRSTVKRIINEDLYFQMGRGRPSEKA